MTSIQSTKSSPPILHYFVGPVPYRNAFYGRGSGPIWLQYLSCIGNETNLLNCSHSGFGVNYCSHSSDVGVQCPGKPLLVARMTISVMNKYAQSMVSFGNSDHMTQTYL